MALTDARWLGWVAMGAVVLLVIVHTAWEWGRDWPWLLGLIAAVGLAAFLVERVA
jgi:hypothetical protein